MLRFSGYIKLLNFLFVRDVIINSSISPSQNYFVKSESLDQCNTKHVILTQRNTDIYGIKSIQHQAATTWNKLQNETNHDVLQYLRSKTKKLITKKILNSYLFSCLFET